MTPGGGWSSELEKEAFALQHRSLSESPKVEGVLLIKSPAGKLILRVLGGFVFNWWMLALQRCVAFCRASA